MVKIEHLVKSYGQNFALDDVSFTVEKGEVVGLLGPNGAGKSTTMNILTGFLSSNSGKAEINGIDILEHPQEAKKLVGYLPEQPPLYLEMTVEEYLNFVYDLKKCTFNRKKHLREICEVVRITDVYKRVIRNLSKGYRQRVGIAQALIGNPEVIIFDEPTVGVDPKQVIEIRNLIRTLGKEHTVIVSTHILSEVQATCNRIIIINRGKIIANERTEEITRTLEDVRRFKIKVAGPQTEVLELLRGRQGITYVEALPEREGDAYAFLCESAPNTDMRKSIFYALADKGWPIMGLEPIGMSLEDVFIKLIDKKAESAKRISRG
ncbi:MAG: ATP-binding cassette domain-containing protein [Clostridia bacterium]|nr:ATP-binding cassette domain-containing protein [Clostridia bacterium]